MAGGIIVMSIACAIFTHLYVQEWAECGQTVYNDSSLQLCLPCHLVKNVSDLSTMTGLRKSVEGQELYCARNSDEASRLMNVVMTATDDAEDAANDEPISASSGGPFSLSRASAHKELKATALNNDQDPIFLQENMILKFDSQVVDPLSEHVKNVDVMSTGMVVKEQGMYFIYSNIFFRPTSEKKCKDFKTQVWEHNVYLTRNSSPSQSGHIFNTTYKCCDECVGSKETSYIGGCLELKQDDRLHVEVSSDGVVCFGKESTYFGLFMLS